MFIGRRGIRMCNAKSLFSEFIELCDDDRDPRISILRKCSPPWAGAAPAPAGVDLTNTQDIISGGTGSEFPRGRGPDETVCISTETMGGGLYVSPLL